MKKCQELVGINPLTSNVLLAGLLVVLTSSFWITRYQALHNELDKVS
jgi:hypothetical protein